MHVCDSLNPVGGYETYLERMADYSNEFNLQLHVVTQKHRMDTPDLVSRPNYQIHSLKGNFLEARKWILWDYPEEEREKQAQKLFTTNDLQENCENLENELLTVIKQVKPDIIHAHSTYIVFGRVLNQLDLDFPVIATIHGLPKPLILPGQIHTTDYAELTKIHPYDRILAVSEAVKSALIKKNLQAEVLYLGIDTSLFRPLKSSKKWDLAFCGRIDKVKGVDFLPEIFERLERKNKLVKVVVAGSGPEETVLKATLDQKNILQYFDFPGVISNASIPQLLNQSRLFVYPSRSEPFGLSILEAMACELPTLTSSIEGPKEIVEDQVDGFLIEPGDIEKYTSLIQKLLARFSLYTEIGKNARKKVLRKFNIRYHISRLVSVYNECISQK
ncbi:MAG: glycosyltransferase family 4 protein [Promethearchaeota archaeon]